MRIPTHKKFGWLLFLGGFLVAGLFGTAFEDSFLKDMIIGGIQWALMVAFIVEIATTLLGKNKKSDIPRDNNTNPANNLQTLEKLAELKNKGVITEQDYNNKKKQILNQQY